MNCLDGICADSCHARIDWIDRWNEDPKPYGWVKTADEILENLATYCNTINDA